MGVALNNTTLLATTILVAAASAAVAADAPILAAPAGPYNWSGFYAGVNAGAAWGAYDPVTAAGPGDYFGKYTTYYSGAVNLIGAQTLDPRGFVGGAQVGYNYQIGNIVAGLEGDFEYVHLNGAANSSAPYPNIVGSNS